MTLPHYFHLGIEAEDYVSPSVTVTYGNWDLEEGLPDEELCEVLFEPDFHLDPLENTIVVDEEDYGDE